MFSVNIVKTSSRVANHVIYRVVLSLKSRVRESHEVRAMGPGTLFVRGGEQIFFLGCWSSHLVNKQQCW
jgi:hypothetical protein